MNNVSKNNQGFSLVEVIVVSAVAVMIFGALFSSFQYSLGLLSQSQARLSAQSVANDRMEYFRSLPYDDVGTISGIPAGTIPQSSTTTLNGIEFQERVLVEYVDDDADGLDVADSNGIPADYKRIKLEYTWEIGGIADNIILVSNIVPRSIETTAGGGTAKINVLDENSALLAGAEVRLVNNTTTSTIDVTRYTDANGVALFSGAPAASNYEVYVTADISGRPYSIDQTYEATTSNPNPIVAPFSVLEADISTLTFQIGELSDLEVTTLSNLDDGSFTELFDDLLSVASSSNVEVVGGELELTNKAGVYDVSGQVYLGPIEPTPLQGWSAVMVDANDPPGTAYLVQFYTGSSTGPWTLIPDAELPNNSTGFTGPYIDISMLEALSYPSIYVGITLTTADTSDTPEIEEISLYYKQGDTIEPSVTLAINGDKKIGTTIDDLPIYKYETSVSTDTNGEVDLNDLEFDDYTFNATGYDIATACPAHPFPHVAGIDGEFDLVLTTNSPHSLRVAVVDSLSRSIPGAAVNLSRGAYDVTINTNICGQAFFSSLTEASDYVLTVTTPGYLTEVRDPLDISGDIYSVVTVNE